MFKKLYVLLLSLCILVAINGVLGASSGPGDGEVHGGAIATPSKSTSLAQADISVAIFAGDFWTDNLWNYLDSLPDVSCDKLTSWPGLGVVKGYDVVILYGNAQYMYNSQIFNDLNQYVNEGGGIIGTPWFLDWSLYYGMNLAPLPVTAVSIGEEFYTAPLDVTVLDPNDPLLDGVVFHQGDSVGYEGEVSAKSGASVSVKWNDGWSTDAVTKWDYGLGKSVYLDFHYITSDCDRAIDYTWGKKLIYNAVVWCAKGWETAYNTLFDNPSDIELLRQYRDEILSKTTKGRMYKTLLYMSSEEALEVLLSNPELMLEAKNLIEANKDAVSEVLNGNEGTIYNTGEIIFFLAASAKKSSPALKMLARMVIREMLKKRKQGELFFGFRLQ